LGREIKGGVKLQQGKKLQYVILLLLSLFILFTGVKDIWNKVQIRMNGVTTTGEVIESISDNSSDSSESTIQFTDENGQVHKFKTNAGYSLGKKIEVMYKKDDPSKAYTLDFIGRWLWTTFVLILGLVLFFTSIAGLQGDNAN